MVLSRCIVAEETKRKISQHNLKVELITAKTPLKERMEYLKDMKKVNLNV